MTFRLLPALAGLFCLAAGLAAGGPAPARAEAPAMPMPCGGSDLLAAMKTDDPAAYRALLREAATMKNGKGVFWRIEAKDGDTPPSFLLGTIHFADPRVHDFSPGLLAALGKARTVAVESVEALEGPMGDAGPEAARMIELPEGQTLKDVLPPELTAELRLALGSRLMAFEAVERMKPWMLMQLLSYPPCEIAALIMKRPIVDQDVAERAKAAGTPLIGLESLKEQFASLDSVPMDAQIEMLRGSAAMTEKIGDIHATFIELYRRGDIGMVEAVGRTVMGDDIDMDAYRVFMDKLVDERNRRMRDRALPELEKGGLFIAVGALHLPGENGLITLLREAGYTVTRIE
ncbi:TraB/GumN family protein [Rhodobium gokarnense]|uniref:Uncharacterized protein YbaP (TraB family) n=1 Tax=Rhodobium gokarnense TaxID=364296 RepID=A0ABT3HHF5_9HYPH|nr:TraB/GumN family protein [Rhodobium gokarnense]MCW2309840.1 uncharacterized protein YbaP (TraB family) [Rhodobium gokarnense]